MSDRSKRERGSFNSTTTDTTYKLIDKVSCCGERLANLHKSKLCLKQYGDQKVD